jgi:indolepyruvate ferredoxin oxidoreductase alpha subunit
MAGRRVLVAMKHVGLNVAADAFVNSALVQIGGGLVVAVADDPGMHSSQNEQDSRYLADFARIPCLEPSDPHEAYEMTREAFNLSERWNVPVLLRLVTRVAHCRSEVRPYESRQQNPPGGAVDPTGWTLLPANARKRWRRLLDLQPEFLAWSEDRSRNAVSLNAVDRGLGVITAGAAIQPFHEIARETAARPSHLHVSSYPVPADAVRRLAEHVDRILVLEDGYPFVERSLAGVLPVDVEIVGRRTGAVPEDGELSPESVRAALGVERPPTVQAEELPVTVRPPRLCNGCPHRDAYSMILAALESVEGSHVTGDIGCYTLGALPPFRAIESCVCMGASVGMAKGASDAGVRPAVAVIGDSTFLHSGLPALLDAVAQDTDMTVVILDNEVVAMTGGQPSRLPSTRLQGLLEGLGVNRGHLHVLEAHPKRAEANLRIFRDELAHPGLSVVVLVRECIETVKRRKAEAAVAAVR